MILSLDQRFSVLFSAELDLPFVLLLGQFPSYAAQILLVRMLLMILRQVLSLDYFLQVFVVSQRHSGSAAAYIPYDNRTERRLRKRGKGV